MAIRATAPPCGPWQAGSLPKAVVGKRCRRNRRGQRTTRARTVAGFSFFPYSARSAAVLICIGVSPKRQRKARLNDETSTKPQSKAMSVILMRSPSRPVSIERAFWRRNSRTRSLKLRPDSDEDVDQRFINGQNIDNLSVLSATLDAEDPYWPDPNYSREQKYTGFAEDSLPYHGPVRPEMRISGQTWKRVGRGILITR